MLWIVISALVAFVAFYAGVDAQRRRTSVLLQQQRDGFFNSLQSWKLGEGEAAQVCIPMRILESWRKNGTQA